VRINVDERLVARTGKLRPHFTRVSNLRPSFPKLGAGDSGDSRTCCGTSGAMSGGFSWRKADDDFGRVNGGGFNGF
jgi:hypothetical protein